MKNNKLLLFLFLSILTSSLHAQKQTINDYNQIWDKPGGISQNSIPLGNGDIGVNAWVENNGDLVLYLSKTDAWSENYQLLKLGKVRVSLYPNPINANNYKQELVLNEGTLVIKIGDLNINLWVDAYNPMVQIDIKSKLDVNAKITLETWRNSKREIKGDEAGSFWGIGSLAFDSACRKPVYQYPDTVIANKYNNIIWCHHNKTSCWKENISIQNLTEIEKTQTDPLLFRTFGALIEAQGFSSKSPSMLETTKPQKNMQINLFVNTQNSSIENWINSLTIIKNNTLKVSSETRKQAHNNWWSSFWNRSYIFISSGNAQINAQAETVTRGYILQRYINACGGRGNSPIKFNGSIFTVDTYNRTDREKNYDADYRRWGGCYWFQNTRFPYWSMLASGDFDLMQPLFKMYLNNLSIRKLATKKYFNHDGAYFPETVTLWGTYNIGDYGCNRTNVPDGEAYNPYTKMHWNGGLELSLIMLDYYSITRSQKFATDTLVPFVSEILTFFGQHWKKGHDGKILFSPSQALETHHKAENPTCDISGLYTVANNMLKLPQTIVNAELRASITNLLTILPQIPLHVVNADTLIAPATKYSKSANTENVDLYTVFPFRNYGVGKPNLPLALKTFEKRAHTRNFGWYNSSIQAAYLGLANQTQEMVIENFSKFDSTYMFPAFWGPNFDWIPDQDHGTVAMIALQRMLIQYEHDTTITLPAWPKNWDVKFKLHSSNKTVVEGEIINGKVLKLNKINVK